MLIKLKAAGIKVGDQRLEPTGLPLRRRCSDSGLGTYSHQGTIVGFWLGSSKGRRKGGKPVTVAGLVNRSIRVTHFLSVLKPSMVRDQDRAVTAHGGHQKPRRGRETKEEK